MLKVTQVQDVSTSATQPATMGEGRTTIIQQRSHNIIMTTQ